MGAAIINTLGCRQKASITGREHPPDMNITYKLPAGFDAPIAQPNGTEQGSEWQERNRAWWEASPMRYDWSEVIGTHEFTPEFYQEIDRRHFEDAAFYLPPHGRPFDLLIPFSRLAHYDVLEIGVGCGSHAQLISPHCRSYVGIDLTNYAVQSTQRRFKLFDLPGQIRQMDAECLDFPDESFDFVWSWGVIHHSSNTQRAIEEISRVLKPGGTAVIMVYHRSFLYYYIFNAFFRGLLQAAFLRARSIHEIVQLHTDGAIARYYKIAEWRSLIEKYLVIRESRITGQKSELFPIPKSKFKAWLMRTTPDCLALFVLNRLRQGSFLISIVSRPPLSSVSDTPECD